MALSSRILAGESDTMDLAKELSKKLPGGTVVILNGPLGAGKTTLVRGIATALGARDPVSSPTFVLEHRYNIPNGAVIEHWDLYRLTEAPLELLEPPATDTIRLIEWGDKFEEILTRASIVISLKIDGPESRTVTIEER